MAIRILIVESHFYNDVTNNLVDGATRVLSAYAADFECLAVPGILEMPTVIYYTVSATSYAINKRFVGYIALGCAIKGETHHYEHICQEAMFGTQYLALHYATPIGNGILTSPTYEIALSRSDPTRGDHGGRAAKTVLQIIQTKCELGLIS